MSDIAQGARTKLIINPGEIYRIGTAGVATVVRAYGEAPATTTITANTQTFGPYMVQTKLVITANTRRTSITPMGANAQTVAAAIAGTLGVGNLLTAIPPTGVTVVSYQWTRDGANISSATASTYSQVSADEGKTLGVNVAVVASVSAGVVPGAAPVAPAITAAPVLSALTTSGVVTFTQGTVTGTPTPARVYNLMRGTTVVATGIASGATVAGLSVNDQVFIRLVASSAGQASAQADSNIVAVTSVPVTLSPLISTSPIIVDQPVAYTPDGAADGQQWTLDGADVAGATAATYTPVLADSAKVLRVRQLRAGGSAGTSPGVLPGMLNWKASNTANWRAMRDAMLAGTPIRGKICVIGDSAGAGHGMGTLNGSNPADGARAGAYGSRMCDMLTAAGVTVSKRTFTGGNQNLGLNINSYSTMDPRQKLLNGYATTQDNPGFGGIHATFTVAGQGVEHTPGGTFTSVELMYSREASGGIMNISLDSGATVFTTIDCAGTGPAFATIAVPPGTTKVAYMWGSGGRVLCPPSMVYRNTGEANIEYYNGAVSGQATSAFINTGSTNGPKQFLPTLFPAANSKNLFLFNDWFNARGNNDANLPNVRTNLASYINELKKYGDPIYYAYSALSGTDAYFRNWQDNMIDVAINVCDVPVIDVSRILTTYVTAGPTSEWFDALHLSKNGAPYPAASLARQLLYI